MHSYGYGCGLKISRDYNSEPEGTDLWGFRGSGDIFNAKQYVSSISGLTEPQLQ